MVFSSEVFIYIFLPAVFIFYRLIPGIKAKNLFLLAASLGFYTLGAPEAMPVMLLSICLNYTAGRLTALDKFRLPALIAAIAADLGLLFYFKYAGWCAGMLGVGGISVKLPVGISFFTFQAMSYVIDCYRDKELIMRDPFRLALYISFFPQLIAGPIVRFGDMRSQLDSRTHSPEKTAAGIRRFCFGLGKKLIIANTAAGYADLAFGMSPHALSVFGAWTGAVCYMLQIYYDFSGYSDMACGLGLMFGFDLPENFCYPYSACSIQDFWHRWHISLSSWFKDYLYIPMGGNRKRKIRTCLNKWTVFLCTGLWHGANLTFLVWGAVHGLLLTLEGLIGKKPPKPIGRLFTLLAVLFTFVVFRSDSLALAAEYIARMFTGGGSAAGDTVLISQMTPLFITVILTGIIFSAPAVPLVKKHIGEKNPLLCEYLSYIPAGAVFILSLLTLSEGGYNPFIYFRF